MRLPRFEYFAPKTLEDSLELLGQKGDGAFVMAGGTDMMVKMSHGRLKPRTIINLKEIPELHYIKFNPQNGLEIGSTALLSEVLNHADIIEHYPALIQAVQTMANIEVRNMATLAGNLCNAAPSADSDPQLMGMDAEVYLVSSRAKRKVKLMDFFLGPGATVKNVDEIMTAITLPAPRPQTGASYMRISARCGVDIAAAGVGVAIRLESEVLAEARIVLGAVAPVPLRAVKAEAALVGRQFDPETVQYAAQMASEEASPISDVRATRDYRKSMVAVLAKRAISEAYERSHARHS